LPARRELSASIAVNCCLNCPYGSAVAPGRNTITSHIPETLVSSMIALQRLRRRLRSTAFPTFAVITMPTFVLLRGAGFSAKTERLFVDDRHPRRNTSANSRRPRRLEKRRTLSLIRCESLATFSSASREHSLTALAFHARPKAVVALAAASMRLICAFHGLGLLCCMWIGEQKMRRGAKAIFDYKSHGRVSSTALRFCKGSRRFSAVGRVGFPKYRA
jgi:hypothetical protein